MEKSNGRAKDIDKRLRDLVPELVRIRDSVEDLPNSDSLSIMAKVITDLVSIFSEVVSYVSTTNDKVDALIGAVKKAVIWLLAGMLGSSASLIVTIVMYGYFHGS